MKYKVLKEFSVDTKPMTVEIVDGFYVREISERRFRKGATVTAAKLKAGVDITSLIDRGIVEEVVEEREANDAR